MQDLNLPTYTFKLKSVENNTLIFDDLRKKFIVLTPEEWVRQHYVSFLIREKNYPKSLIALEKQLVLNNRIKRTDILVFNTAGNPEIIVECKAPSIKITQATFDQIAQYNLKLNATYLIVTNGLEHFYCKMDFKNESYIFLKEVPNYQP
ncbi:type I restriction enzyme HsdR N-terminal domain-containing protein [Polaribacter sp. HL-MS24]|uniref:type I restriction enzyme HsdR N-terminal domain-containing protein n=1 Tax=Polaribacter sp. HL-MS24 TaxID=3077735 RepID=UPI002934E86A|nr:type I restriction enzyme HsdR N-terminal domain-containing protein [Polaribacter sp. HL-MS24]WOC39994.1 type I restriction enzyme HsdR N-terminal domain-containing protein [Polaribacter sp. HL-MS24]